MAEDPIRTPLEFLRISRLSGQHLSIPRAELREMGMTGSKDDYLAIFKLGGFLLLAPLQKTESIQLIEEKIMSALAGGTGDNRQVHEPVATEELVKYSARNRKKGKE